MPTTRRQRSLQNSAVADTTVSATATGTTSTSTRRSTRRRKAEDIVEDETIPAVVKQETEVEAEAKVEAEGPGSDGDNNYNKDNNDNNDNKEGSTKNNTYILDGKEFSSYQDFVAAKRKRNQAVLSKLGFGSSDGGIHKRLKLVSKDTNAAAQRGLKSNKKKSAAAAPPVRSRRSSRISGDRTKLVALDMYVNDWHRENTATIVTKDGNGDGDGEDDDSEEAAQETFFKGRVNDGSALSLKNAIDLNDPKWIHDDSEEIAKDLLNELTTAEGSKEQNKSATRSPVSVVSSSSSSSSSWEAELADKVEALSIDKEEWVCKVTPDRIYSVATHPSRSKLICCAGDKQGYVGLWDVDGISGRGNNGGKDAENNGVVSLFRVHSRPICCLEWLNKEHMVTASYDGSVRRLNAETGTFDEIFATYDDSDSTYLEDLGFGLDQGYRYWTQSVTVDHRCKGASNPGLFVSTSKGDVFHVDLRVSNKEKITFHETISEKKINTVSLHPNGTTLAASGNDGVVQLFDIRKFRDSRHSSKSPKPLCAQVAGLSVSSSLFSPSGKSLLTTSFTNRLDLTEDAHLAKGGKTIKPTHCIRHNNQTGRCKQTYFLFA